MIYLVRSQLGDRKIIKLPQYQGWRKKLKKNLWKEYAVTMSMAQLKHYLPEVIPQLLISYSEYQDQMATQ